MRAALFITCYVVFCIPNAFSGSMSSAPARQDWTGFHSGWILGGQTGRSTDTTGAFGYNADNDAWNYHESGLNAGAEFGYSYAWQQFIAGPEIELGYLGMNGRDAQPASPGFDTIGKSSSDFYTTLRARLGVELNQYLVFATGGAIGVNYITQVVDKCTMAPCGGSTMHAQKNGFVWGYTVGGGVERFFTKGWSTKLECLYFDLDKQNFSGITNLGTPYDWTGQAFGYIIHGGLNYHF